MNLPTRRGFAVLSFLALAALPCAQAVSITQTHSFNFGGLAAGAGGVGGTGRADIIPFSTDLGTLSSAVLELTLTGSALSREDNPFSFAQSHQPAVWLHGDGFVGDLSPRLFFNTAINGTPMTLAPNSSFYFSTPISFAFNQTYSSPAQLAALCLPASDSLYAGVIINGANGNGMIQATGTGVVSLTYVYNAAASASDSVPDSGSPLALAVFTLVGFFAIHRRMNLSRPTV